MQRISKWCVIGIFIVAGPVLDVGIRGAISQQRGTILAWLECHDCSEEELHAVVILGDQVVPTLRAVLFGGPSCAKRAAVRDHLESAYKKMKEDGARLGKPDLPMSKKEYVDTHLENLVARYQIRAAQALEKIGGPEASKALQAARDADLADEARKFLKALLTREKESAN